MIEKRETALAERAPKPQPTRGNPYTLIYDSDSADEAMKILGIASVEERPGGGWADGKLKLETWAAQAAISRPGRARLDEQDVDNVRILTRDPDKLRWPRDRSR